MDRRGRVYLCRREHRSGRALDLRGLTRGLTRGLPAAPQPRGGGRSECIGPIISKHCNDQDPQFLALKNAYRINSGIKPGQPKGTPSHPYVTDAPQWPIQGLHAASTKGTSAARPTTIYPYSWPSGCTNCAELSISTYVQNIWEPSDGTEPNFGGTTTPSYDDNTPGHSYSDYPDFFGLCGPGAADVALWYWPWPPNTGNFSAMDSHTSVTTYWKGKDPYDLTYRLRGYMVQLAWNIHPPSFPNWKDYHSNPQGNPVNGLMQSTSASTDWMVRDALNWEAAGENPNSSPPWQQYYYALEPSSDGSTTFHDRVWFDVVFSNVPVVVLLDANAGLPNWPAGSGTHHFITVVGYNDDAAGGPEYAYMDTCGQSTHCNQFAGNFDGGVKVAQQSAVWNAIWTYGDWIW